MNSPVKIIVSNVWYLGKGLWKQGPQNKCTFTKCTQALNQLFTG